MRLPLKSFQIDSKYPEFGFIELQSPTEDKFVVQFCSPHSSEDEFRLEDGAVWTEQGYQQAKIIPHEICTATDNSSFCIRNYDPTAPLKLGQSS